MPAEPRNHHYVPQWYQRRFIRPESRDQELVRLDLRPDTIVGRDGHRWRRPATSRKGPRHLFCETDLYTRQLGGVRSTELERLFFGKVDDRGKRAMDQIAGPELPIPREGFLQDFLEYLSTQKLRTPKGLAWLQDALRSVRREDPLDFVERLPSVFASVWAECVWQIADATQSPTKLIVSDHPVTTYNKACKWNNPRYCKGPNDPDLRWNGSHTIFPLSADRVLILTHVPWACNPWLPPTALRPHPRLLRPAMFNILDIQVDRHLSEEEVREINFIIKKRAWRYIAAGQEDWLYPERYVTAAWRDLGVGHLLMPDPFPLTPGAEYAVGYGDGSIEAMDSYGRRLGNPEFGREARGGPEHLAHARWCGEFRQRFGDDHRGTTLDHALRQRRVQHQGSHRASR